MTKIQILSAPGCVKCIHAKEMVEGMVKELKAEYKNIEMEIIDITEKPEYVQKYMLMTTPGIVINGKLEFSGVPDKEKLRKKIEEDARN